MGTQELLAARLRAIARATPWCMQALQAVAQLGLPHCCIGAGAVRQLVWDALHGVAHPSAPGDMTWPISMRPICSRSAKRNCASAWKPAARRAVGGVQPGPGAPVFEAISAMQPPLRSLDEAIASGPEFATAVGIHLQPGGGIGILAPHGLDDLFNMIRATRHASVRTAMRSAWPARTTRRAGRASPSFLVNNGVKHN
jgi:hypothetical protein